MKGRGFIDLYSIKNTVKNMNMNTTSVWTHQTVQHSHF